jgi:hypothetical protein
VWAGDTGRAHGVEASGDQGILESNCEPARGVMDAGSGILHRLRKIRCQLGGVIERERAHAEPLPQKLARIVDSVVGDVGEHERCRLIAHVGEHTISHWIWHKDELARIAQRARLLV